MSAPARRSLTEALARLAARHPEQWSTEYAAALFASPLREHYESQRRVRVTTTYDGGETLTRTGTVSTTSGWRPSFMLMHRSNATGSWDLLDPERDVVTHVQYGRTYVPVENLYRIPARA